MQNTKTTIGDVLAPTYRTPLKTKRERIIKARGFILINKRKTCRNKIDCIRDKCKKHLAVAHDMLQKTVPIRQPISRSVQFNNFSFIKVCDLEPQTMQVA